MKRRTKAFVFFIRSLLASFALAITAGTALSQQAVVSKDVVDQAVYICSLGKTDVTGISGGLSLLKTHILDGKGEFSQSEIPSVLGSSVGSDDAKTELFKVIQACVIQHTYGSLPPPAPPPLKRVSVCPLAAYSDSYFAVSTDGSANNVTGWFHANSCQQFTLDSGSTSIFVSMVKYSEYKGTHPDTINETFKGYSMKFAQVPETFVYPYRVADIVVCASRSNNDWGIVGLYQDLDDFTTHNGTVTQACSGDNVTSTFYEIPLNYQTSYFSVRDAGG